MPRPAHPYTAPMRTLPRLAAAVSLLLVAATSIAQSPPPRPAAPPPPAPPAQAVPANPLRLEPARFDLGAVAPGSVHQRTFRIVNGSTAAVRIRAATPNCRCTTVTDIVGRTIPAGGSIELTAAFDAPRTPGEKDARVTIVFEGQQRPLIAEIKGDVTLPIRVEPPFIDALQDKVAGTVTLRSLDGRPFRILSSGGTTPIFEGPPPAEPRAVHTIRWNLAGRSCEQMPLWWIVATDHPDCPIVPLRIRHECTGSRHDPERFTRFWFAQEQLIDLGRIHLARPDGPASIDQQYQIDHYNPRGRGRVERPDWKDVRAVTLPDSAPLTVELLGTRMDGEDSAILLLRFVPKPGAAAGLVDTRLRIVTASGAGEVPVVAVLAP